MESPGGPFETRGFLPTALWWAGSGALLGRDRYQLLAHQHTELFNQLFERLAFRGHKQDAETFCILHMANKQVNCVHVHALTSFRSALVAVDATTCRPLGAFPCG